MRIAVHFCEQGTGYADAVNMDSVAKYAANLPDVVDVQVHGLRPQLDPARLAHEIAEQQVDRVVIAGDAPGYFKPAFTRAMVAAGRDPMEVRLASFGEHGAASENPTERAKSIVACATFGVPFGLAAVPDFSSVHPATLVIGGGVAGIQASLEIADSGRKVYLVERQGTIGGHMAMFDKTFPTLDCAACILTPKMVAVGQHEMIELMTRAEVQEVTGSPGAYKVLIRKHARRIDVDACVACGACQDVCPASVPSEFDCGLTERKAAYMPFPQAVPNAFLIDGENCRYVQSDGKRCGLCIKACPKECINLDEQDELVEVQVGNIILATGYEVLDARRVERYEYGTLPNVLTALEFERMTNASGPTGGKIVMKTRQYNKRSKTEEWVVDPEGPSPQRIAIIHCVGSRDTNYSAYCSRVCCMYSLKFAHLVKEKLPDAECYEFYIDMRAFGKGYEEFAERIKEEGTFVVRGRSARVTGTEDQMIIRGEDIINDRILELPVDMVLLAVGLVPASGMDELGQMLGVSRGPDGWYSELNYNGDPTETEQGGIYVAGVCQGPKDIPDTVAQASAAAAAVLKSISRGRVQGSRANLSLPDIESRAKSLVTV